MVVVGSIKIKSSSSNPRRIINEKRRRCEEGRRTTNRILKQSSKMKSNYKKIEIKEEEAGRRRIN